MGWTREQAIEYGIEASEVERYVVYPGPGLRVHDRPARDRASCASARAPRSATRFSIREFHSVVLSAGVVPLEILEREVDAYIAERNRAVASATGVGPAAAHELALGRCIERRAVDELVDRGVDRRRGTRCRAKHAVGRRLAT